MTLKKIRNVGIIAHVDAGKTTLTERILFVSGRVHRAGDVDAGNTTTDHRPEERQMGITITAANVACHWRDHRVQIIDTPGHVDFTMEVERSLRVLDGAVVVLDAVAGVEAQTCKVWAQASAHRVPRLVFVNKMDREGADLDRCLTELDNKVGARVALVTLPCFEAGRLTGVYDVVRQVRLTFENGGRDVTESALRPKEAELVHDAQERLCDLCADLDDEFAEKYLEGTLSPADFVSTLRRASLENDICVVTCGSAYRDIAVPALLDAVVDYLPSPADRPAVRCEDTGATRPAKTEVPFSALAFSVLRPKFGQVTLLRVYSGTLRKGDATLIARTGRRIRIGRMMRLFADRHEDVAVAEAGDIIALVNNQLRTGDTLSAPDDPVVLEPVTAPEPVMRVSVEPRTRRDQERLAEGLERLTAEDPSLRVGTDPQTGQTLLGGMGELHLAISVRRLKGDHGVEVRTGIPLVAYREVLLGTAEYEYRLSAQNGGPGMFAQVRLAVAPGETGRGLVFTDETRGISMPSSYVPGVVSGIEQAMLTGVGRDHPMRDVQVRLLDGKAHSNDSSLLTFEIAARRAFEHACRLAEIGFEEPILAVEVRWLDAETSVGSIVQDVHRRRGRVVSIDRDGRAQVVKARMPLSESFGYADAVRGLSKGHATVSSELDGYAPVPATGVKASA